ncbi:MULTISPECIES: glutathione S-transferase [Agrobacterium]|uniref:Glutathione S-transferase n=1 Tax=Agrobacterium radiobacter TaxID=362 RepID=A0ABD5LRM7_AGRRD|nr:MULTISPECIES: glutathione S-transferase [Agrobacterium]MCP2137982.1 glutathione S-transferase [Rhizobium sp. SLBN-94]MBB4320673.1 glutathione S-transferase [Agrobacterium radiobacter]MBB4337337.1 glutathione S-transferase [Agrobacterium radiobacter]MBB4492414.1 glutathione S-transferase [Agrobacterium radiobacter]MBB4497313.1 glutathione S-transferase [Agrobacterium radiobacter]
MSNFELYYWPVPFRGQFIRGILAHCEYSWDEHGADGVEEIMSREPGKQPVAFMGPPVLIDRERSFAISQMPAIAMYLGERLDLLPKTVEGRALSAKLVNDANDVLDELTLDGGREMWTPEKWGEFVPRLQKWVRIFEDTGTRHGLSAGTGFLLGTESPGVADIVTAILWRTMASRFPTIRRIIEDTSPVIWGLSTRVDGGTPLAGLSRRSFEDYGEAYCGGEIERSLRKVAG